MNVERRYEATLVELRHARRELEYYQEMSSRQLAEMVRVAERTAPPTMVGVDYGRSPSESIVAFQVQHDRRSREMGDMQERTYSNLINSFKLPKEFIDGSMKLTANVPKEPEPTGRIIDLES